MTDSHLGIDYRSFLCYNNHQSARGTNFDGSKRAIYRFYAKKRGKNTPVYGELLLHKIAHFGIIKAVNFDYRSSVFTKEAML